MQGAHKNYMSIAVSVLTTSRVARNSGGAARQENRPQSATAYSSVRYRQAPGFPERIIDSQNVFILIASRKDFARQNYKIQASLTRIS